MFMHSGGVADDTALGAVQSWTHLSGPIDSPPFLCLLLQVHRLPAASCHESTPLCFSRPLRMRWPAGAKSGRPMLAEPGPAQPSRDVVDALGQTMLYFVLWRD